MLKMENVAEDNISQSNMNADCNAESQIQSNFNNQNQNANERSNNNHSKEIEQRNKREYNKLNSEILSVMNNYFQQKNYPTRNEIKQLSQKFKFSFVKVDNWFKHKRRQQAKKGLLAFLKRKTFNKSQNLILLHCLQKCFQPNYNQYKQIGQFTKCDLKNVRNWFSYKRKQFYKFQRSKQDVLNLEFKVIEEREQNLSEFQKQLEEFIMEQVPEKHKETFWDLPALLGQLKCFISSDNKLEKISLENHCSNFSASIMQQQQQQQQSQLQIQTLLQQKFLQSQQQQQSQQLAMNNWNNFHSLLSFQQQQQQQHQNYFGACQNLSPYNNNELELNKKINYLQSQIAQHFCQIQAAHKIKENVNQMNNMNNYLRFMQSQQILKNNYCNMNINSVQSSTNYCKQENDVNIKLEQHF